MDTLFKAQKRCIRAICNKGPRVHCRPLFHELKILTVYDLYILDCALFAIKFPHLFVDNTIKHAYETRRKENLVLSQTHISSVLKGPLNSVIKIFNKLPCDLKDLPLKIFKRKLLAFLHSHKFYNVDEYLHASCS